MSVNAESFSSWGKPVGLRFAWIVLFFASGIWAFGDQSSAPRIPSLEAWPAGQSPAEIGTRVAENFVGYKLNYERDPNWKYIFYPETCAWYGSLTVASLTTNNALRDQLLRKFDPLFAS